ncbi:hypothetical protein Pla123a_48780 [Posidoniimonas polymericola]|uniref:Lipoprotein n=1 Tax=Posidoniimonas polymericola TaxID=2528002 RepID=A0A5C5XR92_9BACT|nr:hypothetical protein [Posidoniimonas polymericola]TWT65410.1 hypothetical protein Pla123a_48780 [Posidoniimonas polymericola]
MPKTTLKLLALMLMSTACLAATGCHLMPGRSHSSDDAGSMGACSGGGYRSGGACSIGAAM